jgi:hypothetical protein
MEDTQNQISELRNQLYHLNQVIESMPNQIIAALLTHGVGYSGSTGSTNCVSRESLEYNFTHKDIIDEDHTDHTVVQGDLIPCEWQVGRLTAQLTSAYERIAALEKQLLSRHLASR